MSKQSEAKEAQNYRLVPDTCGNCLHYRSKIVEKDYYGFNGWSVSIDESGKKCALGGFAVKKTAICDRHEGLASK